MFDHYLAPEPSTARPLRRKILVTTSMVAHAAAVCALVGIGAWRIDKLKIEAPPPVYFGSVFVKPGDPGGGGGAPPPLPKLRKRAEAPADKRVVKDVVQPTDDAERADTDPGDDGEDGSPDGSEFGAAGGRPDGVLDGTGTGDGIGVGPGNGPGDGIGAVAQREPPPPPKEKIVPPTMIEGFRIAGDPHIGAPRTVKVEMQNRGIKQTRAAVKMCIDATGRVSHLSMMRSSGFDAYDSVLLTEMRKWRYRPYVIDGRPVPVCTSVTFIFRMN